MGKKIGAAIVFLLAVLVVVICLQPSEAQITRSLRVSAPIETVFAQFNDPRLLDVFSPWLKPDPNVKKTFEGPATGVGAVFAWEGNREVGAGRMTIIESVPNEVVRYQMEFLKPMHSFAKTEFAVKQEGSEIVVTETMYMHKNFLSKAFGLFCNMDKMIGSKFEETLAGMKQVVEGAKK